jgi:single-stranded DNA-binding protein
MDHTTVHGDVIAEPVLRYLPDDDMPYVTFAIDSTDPAPAQAARCEVIAYRRLAENTALTLRPGMTVTITGHLTTGVAAERQVEATDIAVSLGYATAEVTLQERHFHSVDLTSEVTVPPW